MINRAVAHAQSSNALARAIQMPERHFVFPLLARQANGTIANGTTPVLELPEPRGQQGQDEEGMKREKEQTERLQEAAKKQQEEEAKKQTEATEEAARKA